MGKVTRSSDIPQKIMSKFDSSLRMGPMSSFGAMTPNPAHIKEQKIIEDLNNSYMMNIQVYTENLKKVKNIGNTRNDRMHRK